MMHLGKENASCSMTDISFNRYFKLKDLSVINFINETFNFNT